MRPYSPRTTVAHDGDACPCCQRRMPRRPRRKSVRQMASDTLGEMLAEHVAEAARERGGCPRCFGALD